MFNFLCFSEKSTLSNYIKESFENQIGVVTCTAYLLITQRVCKWKAENNIEEVISSLSCTTCNIHFFLVILHLTMLSADWVLTGNKRGLIRLD